MSFHSVSSKLLFFLSLAQLGNGAALQTTLLCGLCFFSHLVYKLKLLLWHP